MKQTAVKWLDKELWSLRLQLRGGEISIQDFGKQEIKLLEQAKEMEVNFITEIDHRLSVIEDYAKGEAGDEITKLRKYIEETYGKE